MNKPKKEKRVQSDRKGCSDLSNLAIEIDNADFETRKELIALIDRSVKR